LSKSAGPDTLEIERQNSCHIHMFESPARQPLTLRWLKPPKSAQNGFACDLLGAPAGSEPAKP